MVAGFHKGEGKCMHSAVVVREITRHNLRACLRVQSNCQKPRLCVAKRSGDMDNAESPHAMF